MILGFTGTRTQPTDKQLRALDLWFFDHYIAVLHHGACVGADLAAHRTALNYAVPVIVHPPIKETYLAWECLLTEPPPQEPDVWDITVLPRKEYHERNRDIVEACDRLLAIPNGPRRPRSGTWGTIDYARGNRIPVTICWPDGRVSYETS